MTTSIPIRRESLIKQLDIWRNNLSAAEEQAASYGINVPLALHNEIENAKREITRIEALLHESEGDASVDIQIDMGFDALLTTISFLQRRLDALLTNWMEDHRKIDIMWRRNHPTLKHRIAFTVAVVFVVFTLSLWYIKNFRDILLAVPFLGVIITLALLAVAPLVYYLGRDDYNE